jgi:hypothetical protein
MMFEYAFNIRPDRHHLHRVAEQVANHAHATGMCYFHQNGKIWTMLPQCRMGGMPDSFPTEYPAARFDLGPFGVKGVTTMAEPLRSELPRVAMAAALHQETILA